MKAWLQRSHACAPHAVIKLRLTAVLVVVIACGESSLRGLDEDDPAIGNGPGEIPAVVAARQQIAARIAHGAGADFDGWFFGGLTAAAQRQQLESLLKLKVEDVLEICRLNDSQKQKLQLAGDVDIRRFFESTRDFVRRFEAARSRQANLGEFVTEAQLLRIALDYELCDDRSLFAKTLRNTLTAEQLVEFDRTERARRQHRYATRVVATTLKLKELLDLRREQCETLARVLTEKTPPLRKFGRYDHDVVLFRMAQLADAELSAVFDPAQWGAMKKLLTRIQAMRPFFQEAGLVENEDARSSETTDRSSNKSSDANESKDRHGAAADLKRVIRLLSEEFDSAEKDDARGDDLARRAWGPEQVVGPPDTPQAGDIATAWASQTEDGRAEWLICRYAQPVDVKAVVIHESFNPGAVVRIGVFDEMDKEVIAWEGEDPTLRDEPQGVSTIPVKVNFKTSRIKIYIDSPAVRGFNEIDAVGLEDAANEIHWAQRVTASTTFAALFAEQRQRPYGPEQVAGPPDTFQPGDLPTAWASQTPDGQREWLICRFAEAADPRAVVIHESFNPGAVTRVSAFDEADQEVVLWEGADPTPPGQPMGLSIIPIRARFKTAKIRIDINSAGVAGFNEIDAVGLRDTAGDTQWARTVEASSTFGIGMEPAGVAVPVAEWNRLQRLDAEVAELRKEVARLKKLEAEVAELKRQMKERAPQ